MNLDMFMLPSFSNIFHTCVRCFNTYPYMYVLMIKSTEPDPLIRERWAIPRWPLKCVSRPIVSLFHVELSKQINMLLH